MYIFYILGFPGFAVVVILILFGVSPGRGSACVLWVLFLFHFCSFPQAGGLLVSFGFCLCFTFVVFPRPGDCLCLFCLWSALRLCNFVVDTLLVFFIGAFVFLFGLSACVFLVPVCVLLLQFFLARGLLVSLLLMVRFMLCVILFLMLYWCSLLVHLFFFLVYCSCWAGVCLVLPLGASY